MTSKVSIIIPYNKDRGYLTEAIESVKNQTYKNIELIIQQGDCSVSENINNGIKKSTGDFIKYLCDDDYLTINSIEDSVAAMKDYDLIHGCANIIKDNVKISTFTPRIKQPTIKDMLHFNVIHGGTLMYRRDVFDRVGFFDESLTCAEEYDFNLKCLRNGLKIGYTSKVLYNYRRHDEQKSLGKNVNQLARAEKIQAVKDRYNIPLKVVIGIATYKGREPFLKKTIKSLIGQADQIRIYDNEKRDVNLTDNGKFFFLQEYKEPIYYLSCDDDIIYPPTYVKDMITAIEKHNCIVTHHGRILTGGIGAKYYGGHKAYRCLGRVERNLVIDVAGTGVTGFRTDYFNPCEIWNSDDKKMTDLVFSLEAKKQGKKIMLLTHPVGYLKDGGVPTKDTIFGQHSTHCPRQSELADSILSL